MIDIDQYITGRYFPEAIVETDFEDAKLTSDYWDSILKHSQSVVTKKNFNSKLIN
jgi:hypothetical protein